MSPSLLQHRVSVLQAAAVVWVIGRLRKDNATTTVTTARSGLEKGSTNEWQSGKLIAASRV